MAELQPYHLPQLPDEEAVSVYERMREAERALASPSLQVAGYKEGAATTEDELYVVEGQRGVLLTSEHATDHWRKKHDSPNLLRKADYGTAALGAVVQEDTKASFMTILGKQTSDANHDPLHPLKKWMRRQFYVQQFAGHASLYGMARERVSSMDDTQEYGVILGIGKKPTPETLEKAEQLQRVGAKYNIRVGVNQPIIRFESGTRTPRRNADGSITTVTFAAANSATTRAFAEWVAAEQEQFFAAVQDRPFAAFQFEISGTHRLLPDDYKQESDLKARQMGIYAGYLFVRAAVALLAPVK